VPCGVEDEEPVEGDWVGLPLVAAEGEEALPGEPLAAGEAEGEREGEAENEAQPLAMLWRRQAKA
jgi:hypothetical protein